MKLFVNEGFTFFGITTVGVIVKPKGKILDCPKSPPKLRSNFA
ncbi:hypothetical protein C943_01620 [Mariniradius saccharolyticus AK6]|uniref:Uncharacterized protein n=1 Tax=Mariniradius saccharolyticus AK6 TaxID=1239962 RepID=M7X3J3_9BACT|nr:hypothetical protein C943_01620 [Mariniradius saccharolyticus AK6]